MDISSNPWVITAADVAAVAVVVWPYKCLITNVEFQQYVAPTDSAVVQQANSKDFVALQGASDLELVRSGDVRHADGIRIPAGGITNGVVRIYHR